MKEIEIYPGVNIDYAYEQLKKYKQETGEDCFCKFNDKELYSSETLDEMYLKVTRKTKTKFDKDLQDKHNEYLRKEAEFHAKIPQLVISHISKNLLPFLFRATGFYFWANRNIILFHPEKGYLPCG